MRTQCRTCLQYTLKIINSIMTVVGLGMICYSLWMLKKWKIQQHPLLCLQLHGTVPQPWFIYIMSINGIVLCFMNLLGHSAVESGHGLSLSTYILIVSLLLVIQGWAFLYIFLKKNWKDYIPEDPTGQFNQLKKFIKHNVSICKCIGLIAILMQALTIILALILQALGPKSDPENSEYRPFINQSFLVDSSNQLNSHPNAFTCNDASSIGTYQCEIEEAILLTSQVEQRNQFLNGSQEDQ